MQKRSIRPFLLDELTETVNRKQPVYSCGIASITLKI